MPAPPNRDPRSEVFTTCKEVVELLGRDSGVMACIRCGRIGTEFWKYRGTLVCGVCRGNSVRGLSRKLKDLRGEAQDMQEELARYGVFDGEDPETGEE